jgi:hypothetical protein
MTLTLTRPLTDEERAAKLWELYDELLLRLLSTLQSGEPVKASFLDVCRAFLNSQGVDIRSMPDPTKALKTLGQLRALPFEGDDDAKPH